MKRGVGPFPGPRILVQRGLQAIRGDVVFRRILTDTGWLLSSSVLTSVLGVVQGVLVARALSVELYGIWGIITTVTGTIYALLSFRVHEFVIKYLSDTLTAGSQDQVSAVIRLAYLVEAATAIVAFTLCVVIAPWTSAWFAKDSAQADLFAIYGLSLLLGVGTATSGAILRVCGRFRVIAMLALLGKVISLVGVGIAFWQGWGLPGILMAVLLSIAIQALGTHFPAWHYMAALAGPRWWRSTLKPLQGQLSRKFIFLFNTNLDGTMRLFAREFDFLLLGFFRGPTEVGYYKLAMSLVNLVLMPVRPLYQVTYPEITHLVASSRFKELGRLLRKTTVWVGGLLIPVSILLSVASGILISLMYGVDFQPSASAFVILLIGGVISNLFFWSRPVLLAFGLASYPNKINAGVIVIKTLLVVILVPLIGYLGNAALFSIISLGWTLIMISKVHSLLSTSSRAKVA